ncbi:hypothetical protein PLICRDRAFT_180577 [Plicaturopsis crispa FD-325 SS-3]|uniref:Ankyrin n=1 Tax=Plicaturopsis crispa FD-325 SS-3 TaxID=944288 RepID=A0A0C9T263_PLICR|nr:hypothetical protein PLICRDRAFT_180577 [Plicaturopsis crispa FD-325 SS-3]
MPVPSKTHRAEVKYNVTTEFPHLGLHSAAATGNVGLVKYALSHGQPINSVLDGVLPLHAACSGGSEFVVKLLIENGADVNAPRLPRRYSNDKNRDASAPIVGTSGSTPLHFAAANGHIAVIQTLLLHGAHPDRPDKHGVTPEALARQNGWIEASNIIRDWHQNKNRDLAAREEPVLDDEHAAAMSVCSIDSKRLRVKRSIDTALHLLKQSSSSHLNVSSDGGSSSALPPHPSSSPDQSASSGLNAFSKYTFYPRLPDADDDEAHARRPSLPHIYDKQPRKASTSSYSSRRPSSAGTSAEPAPPRNRKITSKYSLLNLFKKSAADTTNPQVVVEPASSSSASAEPSPRGLPGDLPDSSNSNTQLSPRPRLPSDAGHIHVPSVSTTDYAYERAGSDGVPSSSPPVRPGILRAHQRSSSGSQDSSRASTPRTLRFDSSSSTNLWRQGRRAYRSGSGSADNRPGSAGSVVSVKGTTESAPATRASFEFDTAVADDEDDEDDDEYGVPIVQAAPKSRLAELRTEGRPRGHSVASSTSSLSPILSPGNIVEATSAEFPFSINQPPPIDDHLDVPKGDNRARGDSVSSTSTDGSVNPQLSSSSNTTASSNGSDMLTTPAPSVHTLPLPKQRQGSDAAERRQRIPLDIQIRSVSSHAQAEALVQRAQRSILEMEESPVVEQEEVPKSARSPLSARLAAYGESLALERRLKQEAAVAAGLGVNDAVADERTSTSTIEVEDRGLRKGERVRARTLTRPSTGSSERQTGDYPMFSHHRFSRSTSNIDALAYTEFSDVLHTPLPSYTTPHHSASLSETAVYPSPTPPHASRPRSRTPDPESPVMSAALNRVPTAPAQEPLPRHIATASKLTRMGFSGPDVNAGTSPKQGGHKARFGIKSFMHSFKGKA